MSSKLFLCIVVTVFATLSIDKSESRYLPTVLSTFLSNVLNQKLSALNPLNMQAAGNQSTLRPSLVTIILSSNQSQPPMVAAAGSQNGAKPGNAGTAPQVVESAIKPSAINPPTPIAPQSQVSPAQESVTAPTIGSPPAPATSQSQVNPTQESVTAPTNGGPPAPATSQSQVNPAQESVTAPTNGSPPAPATSQSQVNPAQESVTPPTKGSPPAPNPPETTAASITALEPSP